MGRDTINEAGNRYNRLCVLERAENKGKSAKWLCRCDCGNKVVVSGISLRSGNTQSCGCLWRFPKGIAARNDVLRTYKRGAKTRGYEWELSDEYFELLINKPCVYCGSTNQTERIIRGCNGSFKYTGIDRLDNNEGYVESNVVPCCSRCNTMKRCMSVDEFIDHAAKITFYNEGE